MTFSKYVPLATYLRDWILCAADVNQLFKNENHRRIYLFLFSKT
jgi:hypothetical protein